MPASRPSPGGGSGGTFEWRLALCVIGTGMALFAGSAPALEWYVEPTVIVGYERHDNILLTTQPHESVSGVTAAARANLGARAPTWDVHAEVGAKSAWFDEEAFDRDDYHLRLSSRLLGQRSTWQLDAARLQESLLTSEIVDPDTGLPRAQRSRWTETVNPSWTYALDATTQIRFRVNDAHITYDADAAAARLFDYRAQSLETTVSKQWSPRTTLSATVLGSQFSVPENRDLESRTLSTYVGLSHRLTPLYRVGLSAGAWRNKSEFIDCVEPFFVFCLRFDRVDTTDTGTVLRADIERQFTRSRASGSYSRDVRPSGSGTEVQFDQAGFSYEQQIRASRFWAILSADAARTRALSGNSAGIDRDYYQITPRFRFRATRNVDLEASYRHARQMYETAADATTNDSVYLTLTYRPPRMTRSR